MENTGIFRNDQVYGPEFYKGGASFDMILSDAGYKTAYYGKWHSPQELAAGYDNPDDYHVTATNSAAGLGPSLVEHYRHFLDSAGVPQIDPADQYDLPDGQLVDTYSERPYQLNPMDKRHGLSDQEIVALGSPSQGDIHGTLQINTAHSITAMEAGGVLDAIDRFADEPFSLTVSFHYPHPPFTPAEPYASLYSPEEMILPLSIADDMEDSPYVAANKRAANPQYQDPEKIRHFIATYYGLIKEVDDWVGKILDKLDEHGLTEKTLVIFVSDHGEMLGSHGMTAKNIFYEESVHVPFLMRLPGTIDAGTRIESPVSTRDIFPTIMDYLGQAPGQVINSQSLRGVIEGREARDFVVSEWREDPNVPTYMVRSGNWKLLISKIPDASSIDALYNLQDDPHEMNNLLFDGMPESHARVALDLKNKLLSWLEEVGSASVQGVKDRELPDFSSKPPNILLAISDDQGHIHAGPYGYAPVRTPTLDQLAEQGVLFNNAFSASPMCTVARASLLTGRNPWQNGEAGQHYSHYPAALVSYPDLLEEAGYAVGYTGRGWKPGNWEVTGLRRNPAGDAFNKIEVASKPGSGIIDNDYARNFKAFLEQKSPDQPFAFWYGASEPHGPHEQGSGIRAGYSTNSLRLTPNFTDTSEQVKSDLLDYFLEIEWFDSHLGQMIEILRERGELENTLILVTGDNGSPVPGAKGELYDLGTHVPMVAVWPGKIKAGRVVDDLISQIDFAPTFLEIAGIEPPATMTGRSALNLLLSGKSGRLDPSREYVLAGQEKGGHSRDDHLGYPMRSIRTDDYLYIRNFRPERWPRGNAPEPGEDAPLDIWSKKRPPEELYRVSEDPFCLNNLAEDEAHAEILAKLGSTLEKVLREQSDPRILGYGDIFESFPRYASFKPDLKGFKERGEYNPAYLMEIPPEILVSELYFEALNKMQERQEQQ